jgi:hypothetical protein
MSRTFDLDLLPTVTHPDRTRSARIYRGNVAVLELKDEPGPLLSRMAPPPLPGEQPAWHPFLSGVALVAADEGTLGDILERSQSFDEFLDLLRAGGFRVVENPDDTE